MRREKLREYYQAKGDEGYRVLGLATKRTAAKPRYDRHDETGMVFEGFLFFDPLKEGIEATVRELEGLGIAIKIITGDNRHVAAHVAAAVGLDASRILTGQQLNEMHEEALWHLAETTDVFVEARSAAERADRARAAAPWTRSRRSGGRGINDAPALHAADVGVSVDQAVDVARETADIVLLQRDLGVLRDGIVDGRRTFVNTLKYVDHDQRELRQHDQHGGRHPVRAVPAAAGEADPAATTSCRISRRLRCRPTMWDPGAVDRARHWDIKEIQLFMLVFGLISTAFDLATFALLLGYFQVGEALFQTTWFVVSVLTELAVVLVLRTHLPCWQSRPSPLLVVSTIAIAAVAVGLPYLGSAAWVFGLVPLPLPLLASGIAIVALYVLATEIGKRWFYGRAARVQAKPAATILPPPH